MPIDWAADTNPSRDRPIAWFTCSTDCPAASCLSRTCVDAAARESRDSRFRRPASVERSNDCPYCATDAAARACVCSHDVMARDASTCAFPIVDTFDVADDTDVSRAFVDVAARAIPAS